jgi:hypothetical protein
MGELALIFFNLSTNKPMSLINAMRQYDTLTTNGAVTHSTSLSKCLDMFFLSGASRFMSEKDIIQLFVAAYAEDPKTALKVLFWSRDCRGGAGEKRFFRIIMKYLKNESNSASLDPDLFSQLMVQVPTFGSWKDVFEIETPDAENLDWIKHQFEESLNKGLLFKWFPRKGVWSNAMRKHLKLTPKEFRKYLVANTDVVETKMCRKEWSSIEYKKVPSVAMNMYRKAFVKNDSSRYTMYISDVLSGKTTINASVLFPHQLYQSYQTNQDQNSILAQWNALPNFMEGYSERVLPVCDVSGSMTGLPMDVSVSLGCYISEKNQSIFKDAFVTFSEEPELNYLKGNIIQRFQQLRTAKWGFTTNLQAVFDLILRAAKRENLLETEMPTKLLIISDMEFNEATKKQDTNLDEIRKRYLESGYQLPEIVFWNVNGRMGNSPANVMDQNVGLVSGFSPAILKSILAGKIYGPKELMLDTVNVQRYAFVDKIL